MGLCIPSFVCLIENLFDYISFIEVQCGESPDVLHSSKVVKGNSYGDTVTYECDFGYTISSGNETIECQIHGYWSVPPTCKGIQF